MTSVPTTAQVVIIGGGVAGASVAHHLAEAGVDNVLVLEQGEAGNGLLTQVDRPTHSSLETHSNFEPENTFARRSGSAVLPHTPVVKMMIRLYDGTSDDFISHHGRDGAARYLKLSARGITMQKRLARKVLSKPDVQLRENGTLLLAREGEISSLKKEYETLRELGCDDAEWFDRERLADVGGVPDAFRCGIHFPADAIIDSSSYAAALLEAAVGTGNVLVIEGCSPVVSVQTERDGEEAGAAAARTKLADGTCIDADHVVVCTGGFFAVPDLAGILKPVWSYLTSLPHPDLKDVGNAACDSLADGTPCNSHNFISYGFGADWCWTDGTVRVSGEDHYSAFKPPRSEARCRALGEWIEELYPKQFAPYHKTEYRHRGYVHRYGICSDTPDLCPIVGHATPDCRVCYNLGCNGWGQAALSYTSSLIPGLLGYSSLSEEERDLLRLVTVRRFALLPTVNR